MPAAQTFPLRSRWGALILALLLFGGAALFFAWRASANDRGLIVSGIELGTTGATRFYTVLAILSLALTGMAVLGVIRVSGGSQVVIVDDDAVTVPGALFARARRIAYRDITALEPQRLHGEELLRIRHRDGHAAIAASLVGHGALLEITRLLESRVPR